MTPVTPNRIRNTPEFTQHTGREDYLVEVLAEVAAQVADLREMLDTHLTALNEKLMDFFTTYEGEPEQKEK